MGQHRKPATTDIGAVSITDCQNMRDWMLRCGTITRADEQDVARLLDRASSVSTVDYYDTFVAAAAAILFNTSGGPAAWDAVSHLSPIIQR